MTEDNQATSSRAGGSSCDDGTRTAEDVLIIAIGSGNPSKVSVDVDDDDENQVQACVRDDKYKPHH